MMFLLTKAEAAKRLRVHRSTVSKIVATGELAVIKLEPGGERDGQTNAPYCCVLSSRATTCEICTIVPVS